MPVIRNGPSADLDNGLDGTGRIRREGDLSRIGSAFLPLVNDVETALKALYGSRLHSLYLYGSVPRGTAVEGRSDLDVTAVLHEPPGPADREMATRLSSDLDATTDAVDEIGIVLDGREHLISSDQRYDGAFFISCLCTPLWGPDLAAELPDQYPTAELAHGITDGTEAAFTRLAIALEKPDDADRRDLLRQRVGRRIARLAFATVLFRWPGWTSDPEVISAVVTAFYPDHAAEMAVCTKLGWDRLYGRPPITEADHEHALQLLGTAAPWWMAEHDRATRVGHR